MWYVNKEILNQLTSEEKGFILTMWYVNTFFIIVRRFSITCFILTMWYVNVFSKGSVSL